MIKKVVIFLCLFFIAFSSMAQFPVNTAQSNSSTELYWNGGIGTMTGLHFRFNYTDTSSANTINGGFIKNIPNFLITINDTLYKRNNSATRWDKVGAAAVTYLAGYGLVLSGTTFRVDTTNLRPRLYTAGTGISINATTGVITNTSLGNTLSNIGTGFRWAVPNSNNVKTLIASWGILVDSTGTANTLTVKADSNAIKLLVGYGGVNYWTKTGNKIYPNNTTDSVGVGLINPTAPLHVLGDVKFREGGLTVGRESNSGTIISSLGNLAFGIADNAHIESTGNGTIAFGLSQDNSGYISAAGDGSFAGGFTNDGTQIRSTGVASFTFGHNDGGLMQSQGKGTVTLGYLRTGGDSLFNSGNGALVVGSDNNGSVVNEGDYSFLFGSGIRNDQERKFIVGWGNRALEVGDDTIFLNKPIVDANLPIGSSTDSIVTVSGTGIFGRKAFPSATTSLPISSLTAATQSNVIDNTNYVQQWNWTNLNGNGLSLVSGSTAAASNQQRLLNIDLSGTNANSTQTTYAAYIRNIHSGTSSTNIAGRFIATGGTNNYALQLEDGSQGPGKVLGSDANGRANWVTPTTGTVTNVAALTLGTTGTDLSSSVANSTTTPVITLNVPTASASNRGALSSTDWSTFNNKQAAITPAALTKTDDTNVTLTLGGTPSTALLQATSITAGWTGLLSIARGGTNSSSQTSTGVNYFDGTKITSGSNMSYSSSNVGLTLTTAGGNTSGLLITNSNASSYANIMLGAASQVAETGSAFSSGGLGGNTFGFFTGAAGGMKLIAYDAGGIFSIFTGGITGGGAGVGNERLNILANGNVGIGTTSPSAQFHTTGSVRFANFTAGTVTTDANGNISVISDIRFKDVQGFYSGGINELMKINPIVYRWNEKSGLDRDNNYIGFSAQNIQEALGDDAVGKSKEGYLSLQDRAILAVLVRSVQEQQKEIEDLKSQLKNLKQ